MNISYIEAILTGEQGMTKHTGAHERPSHEEIAQLAYHFYEARGRRDGQDLDDWLAAEQELAHHYGWPRRERETLIAVSQLDEPRGHGGYTLERIESVEH
jgi:hypothetical protein